MGVKERLALLRGQIGIEGTKSPGARPSVTERVGRLRPGLRAGMDEEALARRCGGGLITPDLIRIEERIPLTRQHGARTLVGVTEPPCALPEARGLDPSGLVFLDTETTGLAGGSGTLAFALGMARLQAGSLVVRQYLIARFAAEAAMLEAVAADLTSATTLASFNGKSFDLPLLATRCRLAGCRDPFADLPHLDLLHPLRRAFASRWPDCRLASAERRLLGFCRVDDLPGDQAPQAWLDYLRRGDCGRLPGVLRHNRWDLLSLAALLPVLDRIYREPGDWGADVRAIARGRLGEGQEDAALALLQSNRRILDRDGLIELARLLKRRGHWGEARGIWDELAQVGDQVAAEQLAKYHEHVERRWDLALGFARRLPCGPERERRERRLLEKMRGASLF